MCLLIMVSRVVEAAPLVVGANRDERVERPATAMTVLQASGPRILGGRDELAGGTWLAVNEHGLVAALTNRPAPQGRDPSKRSRGELPLALARHKRSEDAVEDFVDRFRPTDFNPAWLLVGDRRSLYSLDLSGERPDSKELPPGVHILENLPLGSRSSKVDHVRELLGTVGGAVSSSDALVRRLRLVLADHSFPEVVAPEQPGSREEVDECEQPGLREEADEREQPGLREEAEGPERPPETLAACVHTEAYGTRSSTIVSVPRGDDGVISVSVADGHPCESPFSDATWLWRN